MACYGLDDSQRPLNRNISVLRENGILYLTLHLLYSDDGSIEYIWTLHQPEKKHGVAIAEFIEKNCNQDDIVYACFHYSMYPQLGILVERGLVNIRCWPKNSYQSRLYSRADFHAKILSATIAEAIVKGRNLEAYEDFYFGDINALRLLLKS
ncbi:MAG: hypothetical protein QXM68_01840 [Candidatus Aenigmatarchaeota archaeon]|nr:hypothetical protein [Candidatus Aenigmarchaeota archaeon]